MKVYDLADWPNLYERRRVGWPDGAMARYYRRDDAVYRLIAIRTGEKRPPRRGEWYLSGAIPQGYRAPNDLSTRYAILELAIIRETQVVQQRLISGEELRGVIEKTSEQAGDPSIP